MDNCQLALDFGLAWWQGLGWWVWWLLVTTTITTAVAVTISCLAISDARKGSMVCSQGHNSYGRKGYCPECGGKRWKSRSFRRCPNNHKVGASDVFCQRCGRKIAQ